MTKLKWFALVGLIAVVMTACFPARTVAVQCPQGYVLINSTCVQERAPGSAAVQQAPAPAAQAPAAAPPAPAPAAAAQQAPAPQQAPAQAPVISPCPQGYRFDNGVCYPPTPGTAPAAPAAAAPKPASTPTAAPPAAPTAAPAATQAPAQQASCLETSQFLSMANAARAKYPTQGQLHDRISELINSMDETFRGNPAIGYDFRPGMNVDPGSMAIVWTDTGDSKDKLPVITSGGINANWIAFEPFAAKAKAGTDPHNGWGFWKLKASAVMQTSGRAARLCQALAMMGVRYLLFV